MSVPRDLATQAQIAALVIGTYAGNAPDEHLIEVRCCIPGRQGARQRFFPVRDYRAARDFAIQQGGSANVFVSALPRVRESGTQQDVSHSGILWTDIDFADAMQRVEAFPSPPSILLRTGSRGHVLAVWQLSEPIHARLVDAANKRLALALGGDMAATDPARVVRVPATLNHKTDPPTPVICVAIEPSTYTAAELVGSLPDPEPAKPMRPIRATESRHVDDVLATIPATEYVPLLTRREMGSDLKVCCPFHGGGQERTPSLHCYDDPEQGWYCYGCEAGGSIYDLGARLYGIEPRGAGFGELRRRLALDLLGTVR